ncbi:MAG: hypothetical protein V4710_14845 [Verrucomicrobiota bacterium]
MKKPFLITGLVVAATAWWIQLALDAHYSATHKGGSTSRMNAFGDLVIGTEGLLLFVICGALLWRYRLEPLRLRTVIAILTAGSALLIYQLSQWEGSWILLAVVVIGGFSLWQHRAAAFLARIMIALLSEWHCAVAPAYDLAEIHGRNFRPVGLIGGTLLLLGYFVAVLATSLPWISAQRLDRIRFFLHFVQLPAALCLRTLIAFPPDVYFTFMAFGCYLMVAIPFILLNFRMAELRKRFDS